MLRKIVVSGAVLAGLLPGAARSEEPPEGEVVAEALYLHDSLPPGGREIVIAVGLQRGEADPATGEQHLETSSRVQLAMPLGDRLGFTADVGLDAGRTLVEAPGAALRVLLREPRPGRTGLSASIDVYGSTHSLGDSEVGLGAGALRCMGFLTVRGSVAGATGISSWSPHLHAGFSAAAALGERWRVLAEIVGEGADGEVLFSAGPTVKLVFSESTSLMAGLLFPVDRRGAEPLLTVQRSGPAGPTASRSPARDAPRRRDDGFARRGLFGHRARSGPAGPPGAP